MPRTRIAVAAVAAAGALTAVAPHALAQTAGRVFPEPRDSTDFITHGPKYAPAQLKDGMEELERRHGRFLDFTSIREATGNPHAVSVGEDRVPAWDPKDTGDGQELYTASVTDKTAPNKDKGYVLFTVAHAGEWCGREAVPRFFEDLARLAETAPQTVLEGGTGIDGKPLRITVGEAMRRTKLVYVDVSPDGWVQGEKNARKVGPAVFRTFGQANGARVNSNRVAYQDGWVFPDDPVIRSNGYSTMTQPEGIASTQYLRAMRDKELGGKPFATSMDFHGPAPVGAMIFHDQGGDPAKNDRVHDLAERISQRAYGLLADYATPQGAQLHRQLGGRADEARYSAFSVYQRIFGGVDEKAAYLTLHWNEYATAWEHIDYTVSSSYGGWAASNAGLDAEGFSHEQPCVSPGSAGAVWDPEGIQLYVDNIRAMAEAMVVHAAFRNEREVVRQHDLGGKVGFVDSGMRVTDADGNPSPPPAGLRNPLAGELRQVPYDVSNTDWFRDVRKVTPTPVLELKPDQVRDPGRLRDLSTVAVADHTQADPAALRRFAEDGGNVVLTDSALRLLPDLLGVPASTVRDHRAYVGYADLDREHPMTSGLYDRARQMFDPVGLGYPLLMERDQYWQCGADGKCVESITANGAPMWTVDRAAWEKAGGETVATADPPEDAKQRFEGTETDRTIIGRLPLGKGRLVIMGGILPQPSEDHPHWYGLNAHTVSIPGQQLLLRGLTWQRPKG
jgi:hypothetical protein